MQKYVNLVDLVKSCQTRSISSMSSFFSIYFQSSNEYLVFTCKNRRRFATPGKKKDREPRFEILSSTGKAGTTTGAKNDAPSQGCASGVENQNLRGLADRQDRPWLVRGLPKNSSPWTTEVSGWLSCIKSAAITNGVL